MLQWVTVELRKQNRAAIEESCAELDPGKHMLPPRTRRDSEQGCRICRVRADQKEKPNKVLPETYSHLQGQPYLQSDYGFTLIHRPKVSLNWNLTQSFTQVFTSLLELVPL